MHTAEVLAAGAVRLLPATPEDLARRYYRPSEVSKITGSSRSEVFNAIYAGELEAYKRGRAWFVPVEAVDRWIRGEAA